MDEHEVEVRDGPPFRVYVVAELLLNWATDELTVWNDAAYQHLWQVQSRDPVLTASAVMAIAPDVIARGLKELDPVELVMSATEALDQFKIARAATA